MRSFAVKMLNNIRLSVLLTGSEIQNTEAMENNNHLRETVRSRREGLGLTQRSLAQKLGVEASYVAFIESGRRKPSLKLIAR